MSADRSATPPRAKSVGVPTERQSHLRLPFLFAIRYNNGFEMHHAAGRQIGEELKAVLERLRPLAKAERAARGPDTEALEIALVNLDSAIEILTE